MADHQASDQAKAVADQAHGSFQHGDNDPEATADLEERFGIGGLVDQAEPRVQEAVGERPMCEGWRRRAVRFDRWDGDL